MSILIEPVYISSIILGKLFHPGHLSRAVSMRVELDNDNSFSNQLPSSYHVNHPKLEPGHLVQKVGLCVFENLLYSQPYRKVQIPIQFAESSHRRKWKYRNML